MEGKGFLELRAPCQVILNDLAREGFRGKWMEVEEPEDIKHWGVICYFKSEGRKAWYRAAWSEVQTWRKVTHG